MENMYNRQKHKKRYIEAITAGERARMSLQAAHDKLDSARTWGVLDIIGGGLISGLMKHSRVSDASSCVEQAKRDLMSFQQELGDIQDIAGLNVEISGLLTFADFFSTGCLRTYWYSQG